MNEVSPDLLLPSWLIEALEATEQNPRYHAEGNVWNHTRMVYEAFETHHQRFDLSDSEIEVMRWASLLHDIGKPAVTKWKVNRWVSHGHGDAGVPFARNILRRTDLSQEQQRQVLELVKYHSLPLSWGLSGTSKEAYIRLGIQTDLRLLGIFFFFDVLGRDCVDKEAILGHSERLNQEIVPQITYEWGTYNHIQEAYQKAPIRQKNALWNSLKFEDVNLTGKLLQAPAIPMERPKFKIYLTISLPTSAKKKYVEEHYSHCEVFPLEGLDLSQASAHQQQNYLRQAKHFISVWGQAKKPILITGELTDEVTRKHLAQYCRDMGGELTFLYFEEGDPRYEDYTLPKPQNTLDVIHPWEGHKVEFIGMKETEN